MQRKQLFDRLQFDDNAILDKKVDAVPCVDLDVVVNDRQPHLMIEADAILPQLISKTRVARAFQTARAQRSAWGSFGSLFFTN